MGYISLSVSFDRKIDDILFRLCVIMKKKLLIAFFVRNSAGIVDIISRVC